MSTDIVISFDTTGSMYSCITQVRREVKNTIERLFSTIPNLRMGIVAHGDYCDSTLCFSGIDLTEDKDFLIRYVQAVPNTDGGDADECYELVLNRIATFEWRAEKKVLILIGDASPHERGYRYKEIVNKLDWREEAKKLADSRVSIYSVQALGKRHNSCFYEEIAELTNGRKLDLNQFSDAVETIIAISLHGASSEQLTSYRNELEQSFKMNRNLAQVFETLSGKKVHVAKDTSGLVPVPPYRFQVLEVDETCDIKSFVEQSGATFRKGRGFYQFTKSEIVQEHKEVVLVNKSTGDMFTGDGAREYIGLPYGERGKLRPALFDEYDVFIQSTSSNRKLMHHTKFLYEIE